MTLRSKVNPDARRAFQPRFMAVDKKLDDNYLRKGTLRGS